MKKILIGACISIPLFYFSTLYAGFNATKVILLGIFVPPLLLVHIFSSSEKNKISLEFLLLFFALVFLSFSGINPIQSFFSYPERGTGVITILLLTVLSILISKFSRTNELRTQLSAALILVGLGIIAFGLFQENSRIYSTIGNPVEAAGYVMLLFWFVIYLLASPSISTKKASKIVLAVIFLGICAFFIYRTKSRSALFAIPLSGILASGIILFQKKKYLWLLAGFAACAILGFLLFQNSEWLLLHRKDDSHLQRIGFYVLSWKAFLHAPIFGYGTENFLEVSYQNYTSSLTILNLKLDRAHSILSEWLIGGGIVIVSILAYCVFKWFKIIEQLPTIQKFALYGFTFSYFIWGSVSIDNISMYLLLFSVIGIVLSQLEFKNEFALPFSYNWLFVPIALIGLLQSISLLENTKRITMLREETDIPKAFSILKNTNSIYVFPESTLEAFTEKINFIADFSTKKEYGDKLVALFAKHKLKSTHSKNLLAKIYSDIGEKALAQKEIEKSLIQSPNQPMALKQMAVLKLNMGNYLMAKEYFMNAHMLNNKDQLPLIQNLVIDLFYLDGRKNAEQLYNALLKQLDKDNYHAHFAQIIDIGLAAEIPDKTFDFINKFIQSNDKATILSDEQYVKWMELAVATKNINHVKDVVFCKSIYGPFVDNKSMTPQEKEQIKNDMIDRIFIQGQSPSIINELDGY